MRKIFLLLILLSFSFFHGLAQTRIKMEKIGGVYSTSCIVNGLRLRFIFDTGASNVCISLSEALFMLKNGYLNEKDLHGSSYSQIANGDYVENTFVTIRELEIGSIKLKNVEAVIIHDLSAPLLLGQSAIEELGKIQIEGDELIILEHDSSLQKNDDIEYFENKGLRYYDNELYALAAETYQKAYDINPKAIKNSSLYRLANSYYYNEQDELAIKYLKKLEKKETDEDNLFLIFIKMSKSYMEITDYNQAILYAQKAIAQKNDDWSSYYSYLTLGNISLHRERFNEAIENYKISLKHYIEQSSINAADDIWEDSFHDETLGNIFYKMGSAYYAQDAIYQGDHFIKLAARLGYDKAKEFCFKQNLDYENYKKQ